METFNFKQLAEKWPSALVARSRISSFTGGVISEKYLANLDSRGLGPAGRVKIGRRVAYPVDALIAWLEARATNAGAGLKP
ncbi:MAG TPA: hypothetical protein P5127_00115 [Oscillospiraceae bacterium]|jgi:hypothetical protein|nr:hypothetical protein [Oscillospiraceae bacterium]